MAFSGCEVVPGLEARGPALEGGDLALSRFLGKGADRPDTREPQTAERTGFPAPAQLLQPLPQPRVTRPRPAQLQVFDLNPAWMQPHWQQLLTGFVFPGRSVAVSSAPSRVPGAL